MDDEAPVIRFSPSVPCSTIQGDQLCGRRATVGILYRFGHGQWILQPYCESCVRAVLRIYFPEHAEPASSPAGPDAPGAEPAGWTCPTCGAISHNPYDAEYSYCAACHTFVKG